MLFDQHPLIARHTPHTLNELVYVLRRDDVDYDISFRNPQKKGKAAGAWTCIPSVRECFIPVKDLAYHIQSIQYDEEDYEGVMYHHLELEVTV